MYEAPDKDAMRISAEASTRGPPLKCLLRYSRLHVMLQSICPAQRWIHPDPKFPHRLRMPHLEEVKHSPGSSKSTPPFQSIMQNRAHAFCHRPSVFFDRGAPSSLWSPLWNCPCWIAPHNPAISSRLQIQIRPGQKTRPFAEQITERPRRACRKRESNTAFTST